MSRLIDADALMEEFELAQKSARQDGRDYANAFYNNQEICTEWWCVEEMVDNQPTVEAVPIGCEGCVYDVDDHTPDPCYECKRSYPDNYKERTDDKR